MHPLSKQAKRHLRQPCEPRAGHVPATSSPLSNVREDRELGKECRLSNMERTFFDIVADYGRQVPDRPAVVSSGTDPLSFGKLVSHIENIWTTLRDAGVTYGSKVGIALPSGLESVISTVAIASHATFIPFNPRLTQSEFEPELSRLNLDALIVPEGLKSPVRAAAQNGSYALFEASTASPSPTNFRLRCTRSAKSPRLEPAEISSESPVMILRTSATTGPSKLVPVTHGNMLDLANKMAGWFGLTAEDRAACVLPTYYAAGSKLNVLVPLLLGERIVIPAGVRSERLTDWIHDLKPTWFSAGPTFLQAVLDELRASQERAPKGILRFITSGSAHLPDRVRTELEAILDCPILEVYGISEAGVMAANPAPPAKRKPGTAGRIASGELVIRGPNGVGLPAGEIGEIFVGGPGLMPGYGDGKTAGIGVQDGWLPTGDVGSVDSDGFLTIVGRTKEIINRGGEKISPYEVETALLAHPSVSEAAVFPVPHPRLGENVAAAVVLRPNAVTQGSELQDFLRDRLAAFKIPQRIDIASSLPKSHTGKILRTRLTEMLGNQAREIEPPVAPLEFQIAEIWRRLLNVSTIGIHDDFFEAGGDSLLATEMLLEVEASIGHRVSQRDLAQASTIRGLALIAAEQGSADDEPVTKAREGKGRPFFFCHGDYSTRGFYALKLASLIETNRPIYLLHPMRDVDETSDISIEGLAHTYVPRMLEIQPSGRFQLGGFCNGGLIAWEVARRLIQCGREVDLVLLIDTLSLNSRVPFRIAHGLVRTLAPFSPNGQALRHKALPALWSRVRREPPAGPSLLAFDRRDSPYYRAMANYSPPKLDCEAIAIVCEEAAKSYRFAPTAWRRIARAVQCNSVPGNHSTCITTHVEALAQSMSTYLTDA
jgi:acyl-CoA synthetase (AMP-forming)/AMP-acid ligase II/thioesterase domain-containing protein